MTKEESEGYIREEIHLMSEKAAAKFDKQRTNNWLNPINMIALRDAVKANKTSVILEDRLFSITYFDQDDIIKVQNTKSIVPMGYFTRSEIIDFMEEYA